ncbi:MAG: CoA ester lyase [Actinophytocola sp.]|uniref:HpcH/HpaI aldolase/citrate lyase family protein n=1 Tax=Actinophytocola sp. TaxID=1872138 RepID=UPI001320B5F2|nr:CoA ester lyase [Actinophytocola sp.]MPZ84892.1 CoA ester lyase [Actinophytocola sp.]
MNGADGRGRSFLYVPGHRRERIHRAVGSDADAVVIDLEDAVPAAAKGSARDTVRAVLDAGAAGPVWVRVDGTDPEPDIATVVAPSLTGIWVPKAEPGLLGRIDALLAAAERDRGLPPGGVAVVALIETAAGVLHAEQVARSPRVVRLGVGEADLAGELRLRPDDERTELFGIRLQLVLASAAAGLGAPIGPVETNVSDQDLLVRTTRTLLRQGFRGRTALHPRQLATINAVFTPTPAEVAAATELLADFATGNANGDAALVDRHGRFVDPAVLRTARETIARATQNPRVQRS